MRHLNTETLARLLDEEAGPEERRHLESCAECAAELRALREQTEALSALPAIRPPTGDWGELEERLLEEGLIRKQEKTRSARGGLRMPAHGWLQAAAALVLFLGGTGVGLMASEIMGPAGETGEAAATGAEVAATARPVQSVETVDQAAEALRSAEERYVDAVIRYREMLNRSGDGAGGSGDPASRYAALETLMAASQAAIREAPADPFLNGVLASTMAERQAVLRTMSTSSDDNWF